MIFKPLLYLVFLFSILNLNSQSFDIDQATQLIRPRLKTESKFTFDAAFKDTANLYNSLDNSIGITFPIRRKFKTEVALNLKSLKIKDIIKNSTRIKASELLGSIKVGNRQVHLGFDSIQRKSLHYLNAGLIGLNLTKKYRILFYSANLSVHEQDKTLAQLAPRFSGVIGQYHIRGLKKSFYYGLTLVYSDGLLIPAPFIGGTEPINSKLNFNYTLPIQINLQYHSNKAFALLGIKADGYRAGILYKNQRTNINYTQGSAFFNFRYKFSNTFQLQCETGYIFLQNIQYDKPSVYRVKYPLKGSPFVSVSVNVLLGKSLLEKIIEQLF